MRGDESFVDDLNVSPSTVSSEVALLLRPAEVKLVTSRFVLLAHFSSLHCDAVDRVQRWQNGRRR